MNNLINKTAFEKMQSIKKIYLDKKYIFSGSDLLYRRLKTGFTSGAIPEVKKSIDNNFKR